MPDHFELYPGEPQETLSVCAKMTAQSLTLDVQPRINQYLCSHLGEVHHEQTTIETRLDCVLDPACNHSLVRDSGLFEQLCSREASRADDEFSDVKTIQMLPRSIQELEQAHQRSKSDACETVAPGESIELSSFMPLSPLAIVWKQKSEGYRPRIACRFSRSVSRSIRKIEHCFRKSVGT